MSQLTPTSAPAPCSSLATMPLAFLAPLNFPMRPATFPVAPARVAPLRPRAVPPLRRTLRVVASAVQEPANDPSSIQNILRKNRQWADRMVAADPAFFQRLTKQQAPHYLWIGCSDSRVPANEIIDMLPGEVFVHRNIANVVVHSDFNCLSVIEAAVEIHKVQHIIVTGHYGCGGVRAAMRNRRLGLIDNWLSHVRDVREKHYNKLQALYDEAAQFDRLCELNVIEQVRNVAHTTIVQQAWHRGQQLSIHGWIYNLSDGIIRDLGVTVSSKNDISSVYECDFDVDEKDRNRMKVAGVPI